MNRRRYSFAVLFALAYLALGLMPAYGELPTDLVADRIEQAKQSANNARAQAKAALSKPSKEEMARALKDAKSKLDAAKEKLAAAEDDVDEALIYKKQIQVAQEQCDTVFAVIEETELLLKRGTAMLAEKARHQNEEEATAKATRQSMEKAIASADRAKWLAANAKKQAEQTNNLTTHEQQKILAGKKARQNLKQAENALASAQTAMGQTDWKVLSPESNKLAKNTVEAAQMAVQEAKTSVMMRLEKPVDIPQPSSQEPLALAGNSVGEKGNLERLRSSESDLKALVPQTNETKNSPYSGDNTVETNRHTGMDGRNTAAKPFWEWLPILVFIALFAVLVDWLYRKLPLLGRLVREKVQPRLATLGDWWNGQKYSLANWWDEFWPRLQQNFKAMPEEMKPVRQAANLKPTQLYQKNETVESITRVNTVEISRHSGRDKPTSEGVSGNQAGPIPELIILPSQYLRSNSPRQAGAGPMPEPIIAPPVSGLHQIPDSTAKTANKMDSIADRNAIPPVEITPEFFAQQLEVITKVILDEIRKASETRMAAKDLCTRIDAELENRFRARIGECHSYDFSMKTEVPHHGWFYLLFAQIVGDAKGTRQGLLFIAPRSAHSVRAKEYFDGGTLSEPIMKINKPAQVELRPGQAGWSVLDKGNIETGVNR